MTFSPRVLFFCCLVVIFFAAAAHAQDDEVIKVDSTLVVLNAAVTDAKGAPVTNLKKDQFSIFENGEAQEISVFESEKTPFAAVILLDTSGSMESRVSMARSAAINFLDGLRLDDNAAIYNFDSKVSLVQNFSNTRDISESVFDLKADGMTVLNDAVFKAAEQLGARPEKRRAIIVLSDGADTMSKHSADKALKAALAVNAIIYTVDMAAEDTKMTERAKSQGALKNFAEKTGGTFVATPGGAAMREAFKKIAAELGTQYTLAYQPKNTAKDGKWRAVEVKIARPNLSIRTRKGYNAPKK